MAKKKPKSSPDINKQPKKPIKTGLLALSRKFLPIALLCLLLLLVFLTYQNIFADKFFPRTFVGDSQVTFLTVSQTKQVFINKFNSRSSQKLTFSSQFGQFEIDLATASAKLDYSQIEEGFKLGHQGNLFKRLTDQTHTLFSPQIIAPDITLNLNNQINKIASAIDRPAQDATLILGEKNEVLTTPDENGLILDKERLEKDIENFLIFGQTPAALPVKVTTPKVSEQRASQAKALLEGNGNQPYTLTFEGNSWVIDTPTLLTLLDLSQPEPELVSREKIQAFLTQISKEVNRDVQEPLFKFDGAKVTAFRPATQGHKLNIEKSTDLLVDALKNQKPKTVELAVEIINPQIQTSQANDLGIQELLGQGVSHFAGSIPNRIYNIGLTASKLNGVLVPPGQIFSFNRTVGDISAATGFKQAYVIKEGRTVLDDGGGVCQDSTTLFRAVLNAGLPVVKRTAHAYRVGYYEQGFAPGLDATVFYPTVDFQFKNDTPAYILIQAYTYGTSLYVDLYGTSDGRISSISKPVINNQTPPPPELRQDDPTLPKGTIKQVDWAAWGATVTFNRTVTRGGETLIKETFYSNYKPWQAVYLVGTGG